MKDILINANPGNTLVLGIVMIALIVAITVAWIVWYLNHWDYRKLKRERDEARSEVYRLTHTKELD